MKQKTNLDKLTDQKEESSTLHHKTEQNASQIINFNNFEPQAVMQLNLTRFYLEENI